MASAASFSGAQHRRLRRPHSNLLSPGSSPFSAFAWVKLNRYPDGVNVINPTIMGQWSAWGNQREWRVGYSTDNACFYSQWCADGISDQNLYYSTFGPPALGVWYLVGVTYQFPTLNISATPQTNGDVNAEVSGGVAQYFTGGADFYVGYHPSLNFGVPHDNYWDISVCSLAYWGGRRLADSDRSTLFNQGHAVQFATADPRLITSVTMWHDLLAGPPFLDSTSNHLDLFAHSPVLQGPALPV